jgi:hypothetical protein
VTAITPAEVAAVRQETIEGAWDRAPARVRAVLCVYLGLPRPYAALPARDLTQGERVRLATAAMHLADLLRAMSDLGLPAS